MSTKDNARKAKNGGIGLRMMNFMGNACPYLANGEL
jgi:hypothetical protein